MHEHSFGIIPLKKKDNQWQVLLVKHKASHWAMPKGRPNPNEHPQETAIRELFEETHLKIQQFLFDEVIDEHYSFECNNESIKKTVTYFIAEVVGDVMVQEEEISDFQWLSLDEAQKLATFPETKNILIKISSLLKK